MAVCSCPGGNKFEAICRWLRNPGPFQPVGICGAGMGMLSEGCGASVLGGEVDKVGLWLEVVGVGVCEDSVAGPSSEDFLRFATPLAIPPSVLSNFLLATGLERPLSFPRLATPTPHVKVVL